jgi:3-hydroxyacyl-CoA dehydrogenase
MGRPSSAAFRTADIVGIDTFLHVAKHCYDSLPDDEERDTFLMPDWVNKLVASGRTGQKTRAGFYRKEGKEIKVLDPETLEYRAQEKIRIDSLGAAKKVEDVRERLKLLVNADDRAGQFAWKVTSKSLAYAAGRLGEIADDIVNIDRAMRWGFNWELGPFEVWDAIGVSDSVERMIKDGTEVPKWVLHMLDTGQKTFYSGTESNKKYFDVGTSKSVSMPRDPQHIHLAALHENNKNIVKENPGAAMVDLGDGCLCLEVHTKMNTIDGDVVSMLATRWMRPRKTTTPWLLPMTVITSAQAPI